MRPAVVMSGRLLGVLGLLFLDVELLSQALGDELDQRLADERGFSGAGDAGDRGDDAEREARVEVVAGYCA